MGVRWMGRVDEFDIRSGALIAGRVCLNAT